MNPEKKRTAPRLTLMQSLLVSEIGRYQERNGRSFIILEADRHLDEYLDAGSPVHENRRKPMAAAVFLLVVQRQKCEVTVNVCEDNPRGRPFVVIWPLHHRQLPDKFIIRRSWNKTDIELDIAGLVGIYRAQKSMSAEEIKQNPIFLNVPDYLEQILERQLAEAGYGLPAADDQAASGRKSETEGKTRRANTRRKPSRQTATPPHARPRNRKPKPISAKN